MKLPEGHLSGRIVEADSAKQAVESFNLWGGDEVWEVEVWTLRSGEPRVFKVTTESVRTVRRVE
jgi:hypothetical protein